MLFSQRSFYFQKRFGKINLEAISQISIQHVQDEVDIELLQQNLEMIVFGDLESSDAVQDIDESFAKLFRLSQLTVEYLLSVQDVSVCKRHMLSKTVSGSLTPEKQIDRRRRVAVPR
jgi:division protein CdvB (Snf7/Vps24/ESCRT-III family)